MTPIETLLQEIEEEDHGENCRTFPQNREMLSYCDCWKSYLPRLRAALASQPVTSTPTPGGMTGEQEATSHTHAERLCQSIDKHLTKQKFAKVNHHDKLYMAICAWMAVEYRAQVESPPTPEA
jgi:hypothetical protein